MFLSIFSTHACQSLHWRQTGQPQNSSEGKQFSDKTAWSPT